MREILFRGKRVDNGEWIKGFYIEANHHWHNKGVHKEWIVKNVIQNGGWCNVGSKYAVIPETVGQYTGLTDENGTKIFEGDILKGFRYPFFREEDAAYNYFAEVVWFDNSPAFGLLTFKNPESTVRGISHGNADYMEDFDSEMWEVIGNIHDNPELLGVE